MEHEQGDVDPGSSGGDLPSDTVVDNKGTVNRVEESFEEGDGREIMVGVVGSDVFVGSGEIEDLKNREETAIPEVSEAMDVSSERGENKMGDGKEGLSEFRDGKNDVVTEKEVEGISFSESVDVKDDGASEPPTGVSVVDDEVVSTSEMESVEGQSEEALETNPTAISVETAVQGEAVDKDSDVMTPEPLNHPSEAIVEEKVATVEEEVTIVEEEVTIVEEEVTIVEEKYASVEEKVASVEKEEILPSSDNAAASDDHLGEDSMTSDKAINSDGGQVVLCEGTDSVGEVEEKVAIVEEEVTVVEEEVARVEKEEIVPSTDNAASDDRLGEDSMTFDGAEGEVLATGSPKDVANAESKSPNSGGADEKEVIDAVSKGSVQNENQGSLNEHELHSVDTVMEENVGIEEKQEILPSSDDAAVMSHEATNAESTSAGGVEAKFVDGKVLAPESREMNSETDALVSDVRDDESKHGIDGASHAIGMEIDESLKDYEEDLKTDMVHQNEPAQLAGGDDTAEVEEYKSLDFEIQFDLEEEKTVEVEDQHPITALVTEGMHLPAQSECTMVEKTDVTMTEDHVAGDEQEVFVQITEIPNNGAENLENIDLIRNEVATVQTNGHYTVEVHNSEENPLEMEEIEPDQKYHEGDYEDPELGTDEHSSETDQSNMLNEEPVKYSMNQPGYLSPPENEGHFFVSDLVWGKVRSHPWWPGQIFDPSDASDKAVKYYKKDSYLVAYFGDRTFAWNDASLLKPFRSHFYQIERQSNSEAFQNAVTSALEEVSRRVELGLACSCVPKDAYGEIETQIVENSGIREESSRRYGVDKSSSASSFEPDKLLAYVRDLAPRAASGADRLDLVIARAQLSAFCRFKGSRLPAGFPTSGELLENDVDTEKLSDEGVNSHKRKHTPRDSPTSRKKERSLVELMGDDEYFPDVEDESIEKGVSVVVYSPKLSTSTNQTPKPSFKIGERISRVASQLTGGATPLVKCQNVETGIDGSSNISAESYSLDEMLIQLQAVAQNPKKGHFQNSTRTFLLGFRSSISLSKLGRKKKTDKTIGGSGEEFEFDDVNDSYWTDRIVHNYAEEQLLHKNENGTGNLQVVAFGSEKSIKTGRRRYSRKRYSTGNFPTEATDFEESAAKRRKQESSPAELILNFAERKFVPSEINLNKTFRRFGPLMESETEVDHESGRAKIIFKRGSDAEVAHNSAEKFNIFGPVIVNYQIGYSPLISVKISPLAIPQFQEDATLMI